MLEIAAPPNTMPGDLLVTVVGAREESSYVVVPTGWTPSVAATITTNTSLTQRLAHRFAVGDGGADVARWTFGRATLAAGAMLAFRGVSPSAIVIAGPPSSVEQSTNLSADLPVGTPMKAGILGVFSACDKVISIETVPAFPALIRTDVSGRTDFHGAGLHVLVYGTYGSRAEMDAAASIQANPNVLPNGFVGQTLVVP
jgi:hypothetical protein